jgi:hypothetical protein
MAANFRQSSLEELLAEAEQITAGVERTFGELTPEQLNWKPDAKEWSAGQCFEHLILTTTPYFGIAQGVLDGTRRPSFWGRVPGMPAFGANLILSMIEPDGSRKVPAPPAMRPSRSSIPSDIVGSFLRCHAQVTQVLQASRGQDLSFVITSPLSPLIGYSLLDAYRIIITHHRLHMGQAERVMARSGFPATMRAADAAH